MAGDLIRSFLAVELTEAQKQEALSFAVRLEKLVGGFRIVAPQNLHLTLHFFGSISEQAIERLKIKLGSALIHVTPFTISLADRGAFPQGRRPRVLWIGIGQGASELIGLKKVIDRVLHDLKFPIEKRCYTPHLTIARAKSGRVGASPQKRETFSLLPPFEGRERCRVSDVTLFRSDLSPHGARYSILHKFPLSPSLK